jgi:hypothetical protein
MVQLALLVLGGSFICCSNVGAKFRNQYLSHMMSNLGGVVFPPLEQGGGCAQLDRNDWKNLVHMLLAP